MEEEKESRVKDLTVGELRRKLAGVPDDTPVVVRSGDNEEEALVVTEVEVTNFYDGEKETEIELGNDWLVEIHAGLMK